jgi:hypothetical protein
MANTILPNPTGVGWDESCPTLDGATGARGNAALEIRDLRIGLGDRLKKEHVEPAAGGVGCEHLAGSAKIWVGDYTTTVAGDNLPTTRPDGATALDSDDYGRLALDTTDDQMYIYLTAGWTLLSTDIITVFLAVARVFGSTLGVTGDFAVNTNKMTVAAASGNTVVAGTLNVAGDTKVNTDKFTVDAATGNTVVAGTLGVTGVATFTAKPVLPATTPTGNEAASADHVTTTVNAAKISGDALSGGITSLSSSTASFSKAFTHANGLKEIIGYEKASTSADKTLEITLAGLTGVISVEIAGYTETDTTNTVRVMVGALTNTKLTLRNSHAWNSGYVLGTFYRVVGY